MALRVLTKVKDNIDYIYEGNNPELWEDYHAINFNRAGKQLETNVSKLYTQLEREMIATDTMNGEAWSYDPDVIYQKNWVVFDPQNTNSKYISLKDGNMGNNLNDSEYWKQYASYEDLIKVMGEVNSIKGGAIEILYNTAIDEVERPGVYFASVDNNVTKLPTGLTKAIVTILFINDIDYMITVMDIDTMISYSQMAKVGVPINLNGWTITGGGSGSGESGGTLINKPIITYPANNELDFTGAIVVVFNPSPNFGGVLERAEYQISSTSDFSGIVESYVGTSNLEQYTPTSLLPNTEYYVRVRHSSGIFRSDWSDTIKFTTKNVYVQSPTITISGLPSSVSLTPAIVGSTFTVVGGTDTLEETQVEVLKSSDNTVVYSSTGTTNTTFNVTPSLELVTSYKFRLRYKGTTYGWSGWTEIVGTTMNVSINRPSLIVEGAPLSVGKNPKLTGGTFSVTGGSDTHGKTDWRVVKVSTGDTVWSSLNDSTNLKTINTGTLEESTEYKFMVRYYGNTFGWSDWREVTATTKDVFYIQTVAGSKGFSIGPCPDTVPYAVLGLSKMTGTDIEGHDDFGNYQHTNGSIVCYAQRYWYRIGHTSSPRYAKYGANAVDMEPSFAFADEASANTEGYVLHRAFIDGGEIKDGFFIDKYIASKDGTTSCKSVKNGVPISLDTNTNFTRSQGMTGCTGILADAVVLSRARGAGWNCMSAFMVGWLAIVSLAQAQTATSTTDCAWYDSTGVKNYPKGCNNGSLKDVDDTSVTYTSAGDSGNANKPRTGSGVLFAKTTHNGANNGVADLNGCMYQVALGVTSVGTANQYFVLKHSAKLADLTSGTGGSTDAWGTAAQLASRYDAVTTAVGSNNRWGNGSNACIDNATTGVGRDLAGVFPKNASSVSSSGTNQFGSDYWHGSYNPAEMFMLVAGYWYDASVAGLFYRFLNSDRSYSYSLSGFRSVAY